MRYSKYIYLLVILFFILMLFTCDLLPVSIEQRIANFESDLNKSTADRQNANFQDHFHSGINQYAAIAGPAGHTFFELAGFPVSGPDWSPFDIQLVGAATSIGGGQMQQNANIIRDGGGVPNFDSSNTYFIMLQEGGDSWYIYEFVAGGDTIID